MRESVNRGVRGFAIVEIPKERGGRHGQ
jgi:hypothetical protein